MPGAIPPTGGDRRTPDQPPPAGQTADLPDRLPCGADLNDLVEQVADGHGQLTAYQQQCTHCRAALQEIQRLWSPIAALAAARLDPPPDLVDKIMTLVRDLAQEIWHIVLPGERGTTRIAARVLADLARRAASRAPGVRVVLGRSTRAAVEDTSHATRRHRQPGSAVGIAGQHAVIDLAVVTSYGERIPDVIDDIRGRVQHDLHNLVGLDDIDINITVDDVIHSR